MLCLGFSGGFNLIHENPYGISRGMNHDGAAVLVENGEVVAAIEEERLNRIKHSNKFPEQALRFCLQRRGVSVRDIDRFAFYFTEAFCNQMLAGLYMYLPGMKEFPDVRTIAQRRLEWTFQSDIDSERISFVPHHLAHAASAFAFSGFDKSLVVAIDGEGDNTLSGLISSGQGNSLEELKSLSLSQSLGGLYLNVIRFLGYTYFDEYKVMGLAPYGDPRKFRGVLHSLYELLPEGGYRLDLDQTIPSLWGKIAVRKRGDPIKQEHKDLAASLQEALEDIVLHVLRHWRRQTNHRNLCLAGGVAHNCTMNGKVLYSGLFDHVFVQPAAHDAGCALGAAWIVSEPQKQVARKHSLREVYWGTNVGDDAQITIELDRWGDFLNYKSSAEVASQTARLLADGHVVGWVQGRSEFGPRALGNRSILADPRPAENKDRINHMVKKREAYRPFAPSVLEEDVQQYFVVPDGMTFPFMVFVVKVRPDKRDILGATTHVDGTARVHTVSRKDNPKFWELIHAFKELTGISVLLNTSFNNNVEPIVDSIRDAVVSFLTTDLDYLVMGNFVIAKRTAVWNSWLRLNISLPPYLSVHQTKGFVDGGAARICEVRNSYDHHFRFPLSEELYRLLLGLEGEKSILDLFKEYGLHSEDQREGLFDELRQLWTYRLVRLEPPNCLTTSGNPECRQKKSTLTAAR